MKKLFFLIPLAIFIVTIIGFIYMGMVAYIMENFSNPTSTSDGVCFGCDIFLVVLGAVLPSILIHYLYMRAKHSKLYLLAIFMVYLSTWLFLAFQIVASYISFFGATWSDIEIFYFMLQQKYFYFIFLGGLVLATVGDFIFREKG